MRFMAVQKDLSRSLNVFPLKLLILLCFTTTAALASDFHSPRTAALGGAGHAGPMLNDSIYLNPSYSPFLPVYSLGANYQLYRGGPDHHGRILNFSIQDGRSDLFQAGVGYTQRSDGKFIHLGASKGIVKRLGVGLGGKFFLPSEKSEPTIRDMTFSISGIPSQWLQVVGVVDNLIQTDEGKTRELYREFILGTKFNVMGIVLIYFDPHWTPGLPEGNSIFGHETGLEFTVMSDLFLRFGNFRNSMVPFEGQRGRGSALGFGWLAPRISIDYSFTRLSEPVTANSHTLGMTIYF